MPAESNIKSYSIREASQIINLEPSVLRYWESQFPQLSPSKDTNGARVYNDDDMLLLLNIKHLLKEEHYTIKGARQKLGSVEGKGLAQKETTDQLLKIRRFLTDLLQNL